MAFDEALAERVRNRLRDTAGTSEKRMFGGLVFLTHGNITVGVFGDDLLVRVGPDRAADVLDQPGVRPFTMGGRTSRGSILVSGDTVDDRSLRDWVARASTFVATLPPK